MLLCCFPTAYPEQLNFPLEMHQKSSFSNSSILCPGPRGAWRWLLSPHIARELEKVLPVPVVAVCHKLGPN